MTHAANESGTLSRLSGPGFVGQSSGTASSQSVAKNTDDNGLQRRPEFEEACLGAVEGFRQGQIDRITATTRIAIAISNECMLSNDEEQASYQKYFTILDRYEYELRTASSETRAVRPRTRHVTTKADAGNQSSQELEVMTKE